MRTLSGYLFFFVFLIFYIFSIQYFGPSQDFDTNIVAWIGILCSFLVLNPYIALYLKKRFRASFFYWLSTLFLLIPFTSLWADPLHVKSTVILWWVSITLSKVVSFDKKIFNFWPYFCLIVSVIGFLYYQINNYPIYTFPFNWHNQSAIFLGTSIPFWLLKICKEKNKQKLLENCFCLLFIFYCVFLTGSKAGIFICIVALIFSTLMFDCSDEKNIVSKIFSFLKKIRFFLIFGSFFIIPKIYNNIVDDFSFQSRIAYFKGAFEMGLDHFLTGVGWGNFKFYYPEYQSKIEYSANDPHSWFFRAWAEGGFLGVVLVFILVFSVLKIFKNLTKDDEKCFFVAAVMILIHGLVDFHATFMPLPLLVGCFLGFSCRRDENDEPSNPFNLNLLALGYGFIFCCGVLKEAVWLNKTKSDMCDNPGIHSGVLENEWWEMYWDQADYLEVFLNCPINLKYSQIRQVVESRDGFPKNTKIRQHLLALDEPEKSFITREERLGIARELLLIDGINRPEFALIFANEAWHSYGFDPNLEKEILDTIDSFLNEWPRFNDKEELFSFKLDARARKLDVVFSNLWEIKSILEKENSQKDLALTESRKFSD